MNGSGWGTAALVVASVGLTACGSSSGVSTNPSPPPAGSHYEPRVEATLLRTCEASAGGAKAAVAPCRCVLAHVEARISQKALIVTEQAILAGKITVPQWLRDATHGCVAKARPASPGG
jgi:hypothetical protein